jgi:hypothetical protein
MNRRIESFLPWIALAAFTAAAIVPSLLLALHCRALATSSTRILMGASLQRARIAQSLGESLYLSHHSQEIQSRYREVQSWLRDGGLDRIQQAAARAGLTSRQAADKRESGERVLAVLGERTEFHRGAEAIAEWEAVNGLLRERRLSIRLLKGTPLMDVSPTYLAFDIELAIPHDPNF